MGQRTCGRGSPSVGDGDRGAPGIRTIGHTEAHRPGVCGPQCRQRDCAGVLECVRSSVRECMMSRPAQKRI